MKKEKKKNSEPKKELTARSPEAFPKLRFFPSLLGLDEIKSTKKEKNEKNKKKNLFKSFPKITDST